MDGMHHEANIWPAVTDTILLMASIFLVLAVTASVFAMSGSGVVPLPANRRPHGSTKRPLLARGYAIPESILFASGKARLRDVASAERRLGATLVAIARSVPRIRAVAQAAYGNAFYVVIEVAGHTDDTPFPLVTALGRVDGNWLLSAKRATTVVNLVELLLHRNPSLRTALGVVDSSNPPLGSTLVREAGYASYLPRDPWSVDDPRRKKDNRRVEIVLHAQPLYALTTRVLDRPGAEPSRAGPSGRKTR